MNQYIKVLLSSFLFLSLSSTLISQTADEIISRHIEAHGGADNWAKVEALSIKGNFTGFSLEKPFHAVKTSDGKYYAALYLGEIGVKEAFDGQEGWTIDPWQEIYHARKLNTNEKNVFLQKAEFFNPFYKYKEKGFEVEYLGREQIDGLDMYALKLTRPGGLFETWYLNTDTYLEYACISQWVDFAWPSQAESYFDDFRDVDGLTVPFYIDRTFGQRNRILQIDEIKVNPELDKSIFEMPRTAEMDKLAFLEGTWNVKIEVMTGAGSWYPIGNSTSEFKFISSNMLEENFDYERIFPISRTLTCSYHNVSKKYRMGVFNDLSLDLDILEGTFKDTVLVFYNTGIHFDSVENPGHSKVEFVEQDEGGFIMTVFGSTDKGENWRAVDRFTYSKP